MNAHALSQVAAPEASQSFQGTVATTLRRLRTSGLAWGALFSVVVLVWVLFGAGGLHYYRTPLAVRGYDTSHRLLRPSGPIGQTLGVAGTALLLVPFVYVARKRIPGLRSMGTLKGWLEVHLFCGIAGPMLITLHTSFKFNGLISAAYWSMVLVMLSGFVGRYLYIRIPRSLRGHELTRAELDAQAEALQEELGQSVQSAAVLDRIRAFERAAVPDEHELSLLDLFIGDVTCARRLKALDGELARGGLPPEMRAEVVRLTQQRALLLRRVAHLRRTKGLFELWHVFHLPLVYLLLVIATAHIGLALYLGYVPFRW